MRCIKTALCVCCILSLPLIPVSAKPKALSVEQQTLLDTFVWYPSPDPNGSSAVSFTLGGKLIYLDPVLTPEVAGRLAKADLIVISHTHRDHYSVATIKALSGPDTRIVGSKDIQGELKTALTMLPGDVLEVIGITVTAYPAYNRSHVRLQKWLGFVLSDGTHRVYFSGDTDYVPELAGISDIDVAVFCMDYPNTLANEDAEKLAKEMRPGAIIPVHWRPSTEILIEEFLKKNGSKYLIRVLERFTP